MGPCDSDATVLHISLLAVRFSAPVVDRHRRGGLSDAFSGSFAETAESNPVLLSGWSCERFVMHRF